MLAKLVLLAVAAAAPRAVQVSEERKDGSAAGCLPEGVADGAQVVAVGAYEGGSPLSFVADDHGHRVTAISLSAARKGKPLVFVLTAYDPVIWDLRAVPRKRLRALYVTGHHRQAVVGASQRPLRFNTSTDPAPACGDSVHAYKGGKSLDELDKSVQRITGRRIDRFIGDYTLGAVTIDGTSTPADTRTITLSMLVLPEPFGRGETAGGDYGVARLLASGAIRIATDADIEALNRTLTRASPTGHLAPVRASIYRPAYLVLRPVVIPGGMFGGNSANFLIAPGVPSPADPGSHNTYWRLDTGECRGSGCHSD